MCENGLFREYRPIFWDDKNGNARLLLDAPPGEEGFQQPEREIDVA